MLPSRSEPCCESVDTGCRSLRLPPFQPLRHFPPPSSRQKTPRHGHADGSRSASGTSPQPATWLARRRRRRLAGSGEISPRTRAQRGAWGTAGGLQGVLLASPGACERRARCRAGDTGSSAAPRRQERARGLREILAKQQEMGIVKQAGTMDLIAELSFPAGGRGRGGGGGRGPGRGRGGRGGRHTGRGQHRFGAPGAESEGRLAVAGVGTLTSDQAKPEGEEAAGAAAASGASGDAQPTAAGMPAATPSTVGLQAAARCPPEQQGSREPRVTWQAQPQGHSGRRPRHPQHAPFVPPRAPTLLEKLLANEMR